jgi:hypothetical protein
LGESTNSCEWQVRQIVVEGSPAENGGGIDIQADCVLPKSRRVARGEVEYSERPLIATHDTGRRCPAAPCPPRLTGSPSSAPGIDIILSGHRSLACVFTLFGKNILKALYLLLFVAGAACADDAAILKCRALSDTASRLECYDAMPVGATTNPEQSFGVETISKQQEGPRSIESTIAGDFDGWRPGARIKLANGQVWRVVDGSEAVLAPTSNPKVRIVRNVIGTLFMEIEGTNSSPKVRRVQ